MITCRELGGFTDELCDLTREMDPLELARDATALMARIVTVPQRFLLQRRAAAVADLHYLHGIKLRAIAKEITKDSGDRVSNQALSSWLHTHGPSHYLTLSMEPDRADGGERIVARLLPVNGEQTKLALKRCIDAGYRIVPAAWDCIDPQSPSKVRADVSCDDLWVRLGGTNA